MHACIHTYIHAYSRHNCMHGCTHACMHTYILAYIPLSIHTLPYITCRYITLLFDSLHYRHCITLHYINIVLHYPNGTLHCIYITCEQHYNALHGITLHHIILHCFALPCNCIALIALYYTHYFALHYIHAFLHNCRSFHYIHTSSCIYLSPCMPFARNSWWFDFLMSGL